jgi:hypothetical protein
MMIKVTMEEISNMDKTGISVYDYFLDSVRKGGHIQIEHSTPGQPPIPEAELKSVEDVEKWNERRLCRNGVVKGR